VGPWRVLSKSDSRENIRLTFEKNMGKTPVNADFQDFFAHGERFFMSLATRIVVSTQVIEFSLKKLIKN
jgi:hypothetical protein